MRVTNAIIIFCIFFFIAQMMVSNFADVGTLFSGGLLTEPWRIFTSMFLHANPEHLLLNMFALFIFGNELERRTGGGWFSLIYFVSGVVGSAGFMLFSGPAESALGASGAIFGVIGALIIIAPRLTVYFFGIAPVPMAIAGIIYALLELIGWNSGDNIAHSAHLLGLFGGLVLAAVYKKDEAEGRVGISINTAIIISLVFGLLVAVAFGYFNYNSGVYAEAQKCRYNADEYENIKCFEDLVNKYKEGVQIRGVCEEYLSTYSYVNGVGFAKCEAIIHGSG